MGETIKDLKKESEIKKYHIFSADRLFMPNSEVPEEMEKTNDFMLYSKKDETSGRLNKSLRKQIIFPLTLKYQHTTKSSAHFLQKVHGKNLIRDLFLYINPVTEKKYDLYKLGQLGEKRI